MSSNMWKLILLWLTYTNFCRSVIVFNQNRILTHGVKDPIGHILTAREEQTQHPVPCASKVVICTACISACTMRGPDMKKLKYCSSRPNSVVLLIWPNYQTSPPPPLPPQFSAPVNQSWKKVCHLQAVEQPVLNLHQHKQMDGIVGSKNTNALHLGTVVTVREPANDEADKSDCFGRIWWCHCMVACQVRSHALSRFWLGVDDAITWRWTWCYVRTQHLFDLEFDNGSCTLLLVDCQAASISLILMIETHEKKIKKLPRIADPYFPPSRVICLAQILFWVQLKMCTSFSSNNTHQTLFALRQRQMKTGH